MRSLSRDPADRTAGRTSHVAPFYGRCGPRKVLDIPIHTGSDTSSPECPGPRSLGENHMNAAAAYVLTVLAGIQDRFEGRKDRGATAVEYGLLVGLIAVAIIGTLIALGPRLDALFQQVLNALP